MKKVLLTLLSLSFFSLFAQQNNSCSTAKIKYFTNQLLKKNNATNEQMALMEKYDIVYHHLTIAFERTSTFLSGSVRTIAKSKVTALDTFVFQLHNDLSLDSILGSNLQKLSFIKTDDIAYVIVDSVLLGNLIDIIIYYHGIPPSGASAAIGNGFSNGVSGKYGNQITWSLSQPYSAYEWWPCKQSLQDKIDSVDIDITTDTSNRAASNGLLQSITNVGNGKHKYSWKSRYPIDYYLIAATVGQYNEYINYAKPKQISDSILIQHYYYNKQQVLDDGIKEIKQTATQLELFSDLFGLYPFYKEKYGHVMAPFSGGMEHQTMTSLGYFSFDLVGHELAHQWFGDNVTCATWKDIWLNEGFATYIEYLSEYYLYPISAVTTLANIQSAAKSGKGTVYVYDTTDVNRIFDSKLTYDKGASAIRVLHYLLGDSLFFKACKTYQIKFAKSTATTNDFKNIVNEVSGKDFTFFFDQWIYKAGYPSLDIHWNYDAGKLYVKGFQKNNQDSNNLFDLPIPLQFTVNGQDQLFYLYLKNPSDYFEIKLDHTVTALTAIDPLNWIIMDKSSSKDPSLTSIGNIQQEFGITFLPNPAQHQIQFINPQAAAFDVLIIDIQGKICLNQNSLNTNSKLDVSSLAKGIYFIQLSDHFGASSIKKLLID